MDRPGSAADMRPMIRLRFLRALAVVCPMLLAAPPGFSQSVPETVVRLDSEIKALKLQVDDLAKTIKAGENNPAAPAVGPSAIFQKGNFDKLRQTIQIQSPRDHRHIEIIEAISRTCRFLAIGLRIEGKPYEFSNVVRVTLPAIQASRLVTEFEGYVECDTADLFRTLVERRIAQSPTPGTPVFNQSSSKIPCGAGFVLINRKLASATDVLWVLPGVNQAIVDMNALEIANGRWNCTATIVDDERFTPPSAARTPTP
jgi:hypothetical protein